MKPSILCWIIVCLALASCTANKREDLVPDSFTVKNNTSTAVAVLLFSGRTHGISNLPAIISDLEYAENQLNPGVTRESVPVVDYVDGDSVYFQVYADQDGVKGLVYSKLYNNVELIRNKKLLVYQGP